MTDCYARVIRVCAIKSNRFDKVTNTQQRLLLWHGLPLVSCAGVLSQGLRAAMQEAPTIAQPFGPGVYLSDMAGHAVKTCCYCSEDTQRGVLLLAEVGLGMCREVKSTDVVGDKVPKGCTWSLSRGRLK